MKRLNIIFISLLAMVCTVLSCSDDSVEDKDIQKIDPVGQLEVYKTSREKEILVKFIRTNYVKRHTDRNSLSEYGVWRKRRMDYYCAEW